MTTVPVQAALLLVLAAGQGVFEGTPAGVPTRGDQAVYGVDTEVTSPDSHPVIRFPAAGPGDGGAPAIRRGGELPERMD
ncbi:hypothetical protein [Streptomyces sp. CoH27]|uniref:hypothetical protein n=1 Tax=Streptomyces sp. CoH27 TaxID=2875763 RepID=UPI001CD621F7|nr:hypothetical protein [Streptomyces sp. CoH27]